MRGRLRRWGRRLVIRRSECLFVYSVSAHETGLGMPDTALVNGRGLCPACGANVLHAVRCQWGVVPHSPYELGEVAWLRDAGGRIIRPFGLHEVRPNEWQWNCGDPQYLNVILFDVLFDVDVLTQNCRCPDCHTGIVGGAAVVAGGCFKEILALTDADVDRILGASRGRAEIVIVRDDGTFWPREDWYDHPLEVVT